MKHKHFFSLSAVKIDFHYFNPYSNHLILPQFLPRIFTFKKGTLLMTYSVYVTNDSGAPQNVAIFMSDGSSNSGFSLVWSLKTINDGGNYLFNWDQTTFGLGWGSSDRPIDVGVLFVSGQTPTAVFPNTAGGDNILPIQYKNGAFLSGEPYTNSSLFNKLEIKTDTSFTVSNSLTMSVALYMGITPALVIQGMPNTDYYFDVPQMSYYLTVTDLALGAALPKPNTQTSDDLRIQLTASMSTPTKIAFGPGDTSLEYVLSDTLTFKKR
ncbi:hypothetical protein [Yersinia frederiksenii]|uniref:hypothetical protein n=1 Tax=Yersinia frederiksenii TaxID=29484 RepID=UPI0011AA5573|nr:hypothetical protein [Yersinia frederiksenii]